MTPDRYQEILGLLLLSNRQMADILGVGDRTARHWADGRNPIPPRVAVWLELLAHFLTVNPPPARPSPQVQP